MKASQQKQDDEQALTESEAERKANSQNLHTCLEQRIQETKDLQQKVATMEQQLKDGEAERLKLQEYHQVQQARLKKELMSQNNSAIAPNDAHHLDQPPSIESGSVKARQETVTSSGSKASEEKDNDSWKRRLMQKYQETLKQLRLSQQEIQKHKQTIQRLEQEAQGNERKRRK